MSWKDIVKQTLLRRGFEIRALSAQTNPAFQLANLLEELQFDLVLDVGANVGQFGDDLRRHGYKGRIVSFEPIAAVHERLIEHASTDPEWTVHRACALGAQPGEAKINISANLFSSSLLPMRGSHVRAAPDSAYVREELVQVQTLNDVAPAYLDDAGRAFLKIDTQGFEGPVLDGATLVLERISGVLLEMSLIELYAGQTLWLEMLERMRLYDFELWGLAQGFVDPRTMRTLQVDCIFVRSSVDFPGTGA